MIAKTETCKNSEEMSSLSSMEDLGPYGLESASRLFVFI